MISQAQSGGHRVARSIHRVSQCIYHCINLQNTSRQWSEADSSEVVTLENIADDFNTFAGRTAQEILNAYYDQDWLIPPAIGGDWSPRTLGVSLSDSYDEHLIALFPNPANVAITIEVKLPGGVEQGVIKIFDSSGKEVYAHQLNRSFEIFTLNITDWASGN